MICLFYSYKGGAGRTTLMANVAYQLSKEDKTVIILDFDFDASGVDLFDAYKLTSKNQKGLLDYLNFAIEYCINEKKEKADLNKKAIDIKEYFYEAQICKSYDGPIRVMWVGGTDENRGKLKSRVMDQRDFINSRKILHNLLKILNEKYKPDYILFDSRPGYSFNVGIEAKALEGKKQEGNEEVNNKINQNDILISVTNVNKKVIENTNSAVESIRKDLKLPGIKVLPVLSLMPKSSTQNEEKSKNIKKLMNDIAIKYSNEFYTIDINEEMLFDYIIVENDDISKKEDNPYNKIANKIIAMNPSDILNKIKQIPDSNYAQIVKGFSNLMRDPVYKNMPALYIKYAEALKEKAQKESHFKKIAKLLETAIEKKRIIKRDVHPDIRTWLSETYRELADKSKSDIKKKEYNEKSEKYLPHPCPEKPKGESTSKT
ncbi:MAG: AAA family ATPase [Candidatus Omnitrophota bacterium]